MTFAEQIEAAKSQAPHWTPKMRNHLRRLMRRADIEKDVTFAIWLSDAHGRPSNHFLKSLDDRCKWTARPGLIQRIDGPLVECSSSALHATLTPERWAGSRAWLVAFVGDVVRLSDKIAGLHREIIGEILPENALSCGVGVKLGRIDLYGANLYGANLARANLAGANLAGANLAGANLAGANLAGANLADADLARANLTGAYLAGANLYGANLTGANLYGANLTGAFLDGANLTGAYLYGANLTGAYLAGAYLDGANLTGANLTGANWPKSTQVPNGWTHGPSAADVDWVVLKRCIP